MLLLLYFGDHPGEIAFRLHWAPRCGISASLQQAESRESESQESESRESESLKVENWKVEMESGGGNFQRSEVSSRRSEGQTTISSEDGRRGS